MERITAVARRDLRLRRYSTIRNEIVTAVVGPIYHSAPNTHANFSFRVGASIHLMPRFDPERLLELIERERITHLHLVPIMFERLLKLPEQVAEPLRRVLAAIRRPRGGAVLAARPSAR